MGQVPSDRDHRPSGLDDPDYARFAWRRYRRILGWMTLPSIAAAGIGLSWMHCFGGGLTWPLALAIGLGIGLTIFCSAALMGLVFLSSGTGHDEDADQVSRQIRDERRG